MPRTAWVWIVLLLIMAVPRLSSQENGASSAHSTAKETKFQNTYWPAELAGQAALKKGDAPAAKKNFLASRAAAESAGDSRWSELAGTISELASIERDQKNYPGAERLYKASLALQEKHQQPDDAEVGGALQALANVYMAQDEPDKAEPLLLRSLDIYKKRIAAAPTPDITAAYGRHIAWGSFWLVAIATSSKRPDVAKARCDDGMKYAKYLDAEQLDIMTHGCAEVASHANP